MTTLKTVKEVSELSGISVRTLHYYDEIGLFRPTVVSEAGYRLYYTITCPAVAALQREGLQGLSRVP